MKKGDVVFLEKSKKEVTLLRSIGKKDKDGQFWEVEFDDCTKDVMLLKEHETPSDNQNKTKGEGNE